MSNPFQTRRLAYASGALAAALLLVCGIQVIAGKATSKSLGGKNRYLTHVSTDKPIYRPGETLYVRGVFLEAHSHKPWDRARMKRGAPNALVEIKGPKGDTVAQGYAPSKESVLAFAWKIPESQPGGEYTIRFQYPYQGYAPAKRKFDIRAYRAPRLKSQIVFFRDGYGPGDEVSATLSVKRAEGGIPEGAKVTLIARVDGAEVHRGAAQVDAKGHCTARFKLPGKIARGEGTLAFVIQDGGVVETATKSIPILLQTVDLHLYPEGGELVAGLPNRVYLEAKTPAQKPADIAGIIVDAAGKKIAAFRTEHEGRGRFAFTPEKGARYTLQISEPSGIKTRYPLPKVKEHGAVIRALSNRVAEGMPVRLKVGSTAAGKLTVTLSKRELEVDRRSVEAPAGKLVDVALLLAGAKRPFEPDGVMIATVWDKDGKPLAERLVYREPAGKLHVAIAFDKKNPVPGETLKLTVKTTDEKGKPVGAVVGLNVTDDSVLEMIEKREQAPRLPVMVLLEDDVRELADARVYLDGKNPKAPLALDLILGTQGWRRFAFLDAKQFLAAHGDAARRVLALRLASVRELQKGGMIGRGRRLRIMDELAEADAKPGKPLPRDEAARAPQALPHAKRPARAKAKEAQQMAQAASKVGGELRKLNPERAAMRNAMKKADKRRANRVIAPKEEMDMRSMRRNDFIAVRVYAHKVRPNRRPGERADFTETLYWNAGVKTDPESGEATVSFGLNDSVTAFRVFADAFSSEGALGGGTATVESVEPFYIEPKLPLEVTSGDVIELPIGIVNGIGSELEVQLAARAPNARGELKFGALEAVTLKALERARRILPLRVGHFNGTLEFILRAKAGPFADQVTRKLRIVPLGFPVEKAFGGMLGPQKGASHKLLIPANAVPRSISTKVAVYPTPLANLTEALARLIREPSGCFEQTSSTTYPLVMAQQYFLSHTGVDPKMVERSRGLLAKGYRRLIGFECKKKGYEWFGADPGHEALSAYGLLEFSDMAQVRAVDAKMLARTRRWLLTQRDGKGGFARKRRALHTWIKDADCSNAYVTWALLESGQEAASLAKEISALKAASARSANSYVWALSANVMALAKERTAAKKLLERLAAKQTKKGWVDGATVSIVGSRGEGLKIETTALAILAWLRDARFAGSVEKATRWLAKACQAGRYGSTQSTVLALRAIVAHDKSRAHPKAPGRVRVLVDGQPVGDFANFDKSTQGAIALPEISELLTPGEHEIALKMEQGSEMPYSVAVNFHDLQPASSAQCNVELKVALSQTKLAEGGVTEANVTVVNTSKQDIPTPVAIIGLPGGLEPRHDQLKELVKKGTMDAYEVRGREVVLYWRGLKGGQKVELPISLVAAVPGTYTGPASRAYEYYADEFKHWVGGLKVRITPLKK